MIRASCLIAERCWGVTVFTKNRERLPAGDVAAKVLASVLGQPKVKARLSDEHFPVDGTLTGEPSRRHRLEPDARLYRKGNGQPAKLAFMGHALMENRHALVVNVRLTAATGLAEREAAVSMVEAIPGRHRITVGADKAYDTKDFMANMRELDAAPHVAQNTSSRRSAVGGRTTRHRLQPDPPAQAAGGGIITLGVRLNGGGGRPGRTNAKDLRRCRGATAAASTSAKGVSWRTLSAGRQHEALWRPTSAV